MKKRGPAPKKTRDVGVVIDRARFEKISAVEGITLTDDIKRRAA
jgi:hypothetical protein